MIPYKHNEDKLWNVISLNELDAIAIYQECKGNVKFYSTDYPHLSENEIIFSRAIAKFQNLVRFDE